VDWKERIYPAFDKEKPFLTLIASDWHSEVSGKTETMKHEACLFPIHGDSKVAV